jgi:hypothetical protein
MHISSPALQTPAVEAALNDLRRDLKKVCPTATDPLAPWTLDIVLNKNLSDETFTLEISAKQSIRIHAADSLGAVYGIYELTHRFLGVDPLWFWKEIEPAVLERFTPKPQHIHSGEPAFRYRGWFINDEDLLAHWKEPAGQRFTNWPKREAVLACPPTDQVDNYEYRLLQYYSSIVAPDTMEMVYEAALRLRANLIIPASFIDIMNAPEADMIRAALRRGFYVSQHHVEPLGVAHFAYESWWAQQGKHPEFSYRQDADSMRACWRAYAERWQRIAGDRLIWQVGLRGRGDRPLWTHDPEAQARAGEFIAAALDDQMAIIRSVDKRAEPPATLTLWLEGTKLIREGKLSAPATVTYVFADHSRTQEMQDDFETMPRQENRQHGMYYHIAVWSMGPHLVSGPPPEKIARTVHRLAQKGDRHYAILNVSNLREHTMGAAAWTQQVWQPEPLSDLTFLNNWSSPELAPLHKAFLQSIPQFQPEWRFYDGSARLWIDQLISSQVADGKALNGFLKEVVESKRQEVINTLQQSVQEFDTLLQNMAEAETTLPRRLAAFCHFHLNVQVRILRGLYCTVIALLHETPKDAEAIAALDDVLASFSEAETGQWKDWYRGDKKVGIAEIRQRILALQTTRPTSL